MGRTLTEQALNLFLPHIASRTAPPGQRSLLRELEKCFGFIAPEHSTALQKLWLIVTSSIPVLQWRTRVEIVHERQHLTIEESTKRVWTACVMQARAVAHRVRTLQGEKIKGACLSQLLSVLERHDLSRQLEAWATARLYFDRGARGNPGPGGSGWALIFLNERSNQWELKACVYAYMGPEVTNNWCEYSALKDGLAYSAHCLQHYEVKLEVFGDSQMTIASQNGFSSIRQTELQPLAVRVNQIIANFAWTSWNHTKREQNKMADLLANTAMNSKSAKILTDESQGNDQVLMSQVAALLDNGIASSLSFLQGVLLPAYECIEQCQIAAIAGVRRSPRHLASSAPSEKQLVSLDWLEPFVKGQKEIIFWRRPHGHFSGTLPCPDTLSRHPVPTLSFPFSVAHRRQRWVAAARSRVRSWGAIALTLRSSGRSTSGNMNILLVLDLILHNEGLTLYLLFPIFTQLRFCVALMHGPRAIARIGPKALRLISLSLCLPRCFPHCCPQHVARSYCGAPVYLQVDLSDAPSPVSSTSLVERETRDKDIVHDEDLVVFGRFRVENARGLAMGHKLSTDELLRSLQSKANPTGDWIAAQMISSAGHNTWLFEVNPKANWFYDWEVGAVRTRRAETHVLEVYVFCKRPPDPSNHVGVSTAAVAGTPVSKKRAVQVETVKVVAIATSSPFTLLSFRRASLQRGSSLLSDQQDQSEEKKEAAESAVQSHTPIDNESQDNIGTEMSILEILKISGVATETATSGDSPDVAHDRSTPSLEQESLIVDATTDMMIVLWFLRQIPIDAVASLSVLLPVERSLYNTLVEHLAPSSSALAAALSGPLGNLDLARAVAPFIDFSGTQPSLFFIDPVDNSDQVASMAAAEFDQLVEISVKLALWMLFDRDNKARIEAFLQRSARVLLDKVALYKSYETFVEWLHERIDEYLSDDRWRLERLVKRIINWSYSCKSRCDCEELDRILSIDNKFVAAGCEIFVAHAREIYLSTLEISPLAQLAQTRIHPRPFMVSRTPSRGSFPVPRSIASLVQYSGLWMCDLERLSIRRFQPTPSSHTHVGVIPLLWFWKQLSCFRVAFSCERDVPSLLFASVFNPSRAGDRVARIVLDRQQHWFECFPSGESTLGVRVDGHSFGDYIARITSPESGKIEIKSYSWPSSSASRQQMQGSSPPSPSSSLLSFPGTPLCWHWHLAVRNDGPMLIAVVRIERGNLFRSNSTDKHQGDPGQLDASSPSSLHSSYPGSFSWDTEPLNQKLAQVESWELLYELHLGYRKLE
ncbi:hypothetical protein FI667_g14961, partial [Globisporangium splendens]